MKNFTLFLVGLITLLFIFSCNPDPSVNIEKRYVEALARGDYLTDFYSRNVDSSKYEEATLENGETIEVLEAGINPFAEFIKLYNRPSMTAQGEGLSIHYSSLRFDADGIPYYEIDPEKNTRYLKIMERLGDKDEVVFTNYGYMSYAYAFGFFIESFAYKDCLFSSDTNEDNKAYFVFEDE
jgi:hypothetical protein